MKILLERKIPKISLALILIFFVSTILTLSVPGLREVVLLYPSNLSEPLNWYRLITYPLYVGGVLKWIHTSLVIALTGFIIENKLKKQDMIGLILFSSIIGGLMYAIVNHGDPLTYRLPHLQ